MRLRFPKLNQVFPTKSKFDEYCEVLGVDTIDDNLFSQIMIYYGDSTLRYLSHDVSAARVISVISLQYPTYLQKKEAVEALKELDLEDFKDSFTTISNMAQNPNNAPVQEILPFVSTQSVTKTKISTLDAIIAKHRTNLYEHTQKILKELAPLFRGIHSEKEDMFFYTVEEDK